MRGLSAVPLSVALLLLASCRTSEPMPSTPSVAEPATTARPAQPAAALPMPPGIDEAAMDGSVDPCANFYQFACGGWMAKNEIPEDQPRWTRGFLDIEQRNELILREILEATAAGKPPEGTPYAQKLGDFYATCMDERALEQSVPVLKGMIARIALVRDVKSLTETLAWMHAQGMAAGFAFRGDQDLHDATRIIAEIDQGGLGLPDRSYYLSDEPKMKSVREAYQEHVRKMLELAGEDPKTSTASSQAVLELETALARASLDRVSRRNPRAHDHPTDLKGLPAMAPTLQWDVFFRLVGVPAMQKLNLNHPPFLIELGRQMKATPPQAWRAYLTWHLINASAQALPKAFREEDFRFDGKVLSGQPADQPRWKKCVGLADKLMGEAVGKPFVDRTFGEEGKAAALMIVQTVEKAFEENLASLEWMDADTRSKAKEKLVRVVNKIGFPERWRSYEALKIDRGPFLGNYLRAMAFEKARELARIGKPLDRGEWRMSPATVNAYYNAGYNEIVFPAGILQPPFYNRAATFPANFGATGMVVGHEFTHGFDDAGRRFDASGNLEDWWTPAADKDFDARASCVKEQYDQVFAVEDVRINGALTLGENIADLGGLKLAHQAMRMWQKAGGKAGGPYRFNESQQVFLAFAQSWCSEYRPEFARLRAATDSHSPPFARVNEPLKNLPSFHEAFGCREGSPMVRPSANRCTLW